jgi:hypothetical protein
MSRADQGSSRVIDVIVNVNVSASMPVDTNSGSRLLGDGSKRKKEQKTALMLLDELDNNQQRSCIIAAVVTLAFSHTCNHIIIGCLGNHMDAH